MLTCCPCAKGLVKEITNQFKAMSLKPLRVQRPRKAGSAEAAAAMDEAREEGIGGEQEWVAEPEPGVLITLVPLPSGGNYVKKIRFSKEVFDDWGAQKWWSENYDKIMELYSIASCHSSSTPAPSEDDDDDDAGGDLQLISSVQVQEEAESSKDALCSSESSGSSSKPQKKPQLAPDDAEIQAKVLEWVVEDEPGVFVTVRSMPNGSKEILRVELSRERYGEVKARVWWEENKFRLQKQYS